MEDFLTNCKVNDEIKIKGVSISGYFYLKNTEDTVIIEDDIVTRVVRSPQVIGCSGGILCDIFECWYSGNMDRRDEYKYSLPVVFSYDTEWNSHRDLDLSEKDLPVVIHLCDVCGFPNQKCVLCNMLIDDDALMIEGHNVCRICVENEEQI